MSNCGNCGCPTGISTPSNGVDGLNSFTRTTADFVVPAVGSNVTITVSSLGQLTGNWAATGQTIFIEGAGHYIVVSSTDTTITATNPATYTTENDALAAVGSTVTLGKDVSPSGVKGIDGANGSGTNGTTVLEVDLTEYEEDQNSFSAPSKTFTIPADTWETEDDIVELEMMLISEPSDTIYQIRVDLDGNIINMTDAPNVIASLGGRYYHVKLQLVLSGADEVTPVLKSSQGIVTASDYSNNVFAGQLSQVYERVGDPTTGLDPSTDLDLEVYLVSSVTNENIKLFYYKLTSMKK